MRVCRLSRPDTGPLRMDLVEHIQKLVRESRISWRVDPYISWTGAQYDPMLRVMITPPITSETNYVAALHELGHVNDPLAPHLFGGPHVWFSNRPMTEAVLASEFAAWHWAAQHTKLGVTEKFRRTMRIAVGTYRQSARKTRILGYDLDKWFC